MFDICPDLFHQILNFIRHKYPFPVVPRLFSLCVDRQIHLSFSQLGGAADDKRIIGDPFLSLLLRSVGVVVTEVQDVEFK